MGLINGYGDDNKVVYNGKVVTYSKRKIYSQWTWVVLNMTNTRYWVWEYHRYCTKSYAYVGMSYAAAQACATAMIQKYTRSTAYSEWQSSGAAAGTFVDADGGTICMADISIQKREGHMYDVVISVREDDTRHRTMSVSPETLFYTENDRDYDE